MSNQGTVSIIIPTYNESKNIIKILNLVREYMTPHWNTQTIVIDDNSPDGTGKLVEDYLSEVKRFANYSLEIIHRKAKSGLGSAISRGIQQAKGDTIVVMDSDFSHPPQIIPKLVSTLKQYQCDIVIASRYIHGGKIKDWPLKRKIISKLGNLIARRSLGVKPLDPMSGFFAIKKNILDGLSLDAIGFKILLEILVKSKNASIREVPYTFPNRKFGSSKLELSTIVDFCRSVWKLYVYGKTKETKEHSTLIKFTSKAGRFYTVGIFGFIVNYLVSLLFTNGITDMWYLHANLLGIGTSMTSNFILNKIWTFNDKQFHLKDTLEKYGKFVGFSSLGALVQIGIVFHLVEYYQIDYPYALIAGVLGAAFGNFILNKKFTFKEKLWS